MQGYLPRHLENEIRSRLEFYPAVAILGPRQCGKSTLAQYILKSYPESIYIDLELPSDREKLSDPELFLRHNALKLICMDEVQRMGDLFETLRGVIDRNQRNGQFILLGSASQDLIQKSSETLAGRLSYLELTPFLMSEVKSSVPDLNQLWLRGGFPKSLLARNDHESFIWRQDFIRSFLERDIPQLGLRVSSVIIERFWKMMAYNQGQLFNASQLGQSLGVNYNSAKHYLDILEKTYMIRVLRPYFSQLPKRLVKSPRAYIRDQGILHALLGIETFNDLLGHPIKGASWESFVIEQLVQGYSGYEASFYRTSSGVEIDLILEKGRERIGVECKASTVPSLTKGTYQAMQDLELDQLWLVAPVESSYPIKENIFVKPLKEILT